MIITLKDKDSIWVGASIDMLYSGYHEEDIIHEDNLKMWRVSGVPNCIMATERTNAIDTDTLRYRKGLGLSAELDHKHILTKVIPKLRKVFEETDMMDGKESWRSIVIAKGDRAFEINPCFICTEIDDFEITGAIRRENVAWGSMTLNKELPPVERITEAFRAINKVKHGGQFPIVIMNTKRKDRIVIYE